MNDTKLPTVEQLLEAADRKVKELVRAIHCLPKPPEKMGDGPDERVANVIFLLQNARGERDRLITRLRHVANGYEQGGHTHRARAFRAIADELGQTEKARSLLPKEGER